MKSLSEVLASAPIPTESPETQSDFRDKWMNYRRSNRQTRDGVAAVMEECGMEPTDEALDKIIEEHSDIVKMDAEFQKPELQPERQPESNSSVKDKLGNIDGQSMITSRESWDKQRKNQRRSWNEFQYSPNHPKCRSCYPCSKTCPSQACIIIYRIITGLHGYRECVRQSLAAKRSGCGNA